MPLRLEPYRDAIMSHIRQQPDATMAEVQDWLVREHQRLIWWEWVRPGCCLPHGGDLRLQLGGGSAWQFLC